MNKDLNYYVSLNYPIEIVKIKDEDGGGWMATIPQLGRYSYVGDGETIEKAIESLNLIKKELFKDALAEGDEIAEPINNFNPEYSNINIQISNKLYEKIFNHVGNSHEKIPKYIAKIIRTIYEDEKVYI